MREVFLMVLLMLGCLRAAADNSVSQSVMDTVIAAGVPEFVVRNIGNLKGDRTDINLDVISSGPFIVYKVEWINCDSVRTPLRPFYLEAVPKGSDGKANIWHIGLEFPFTTSFGDYDQSVNAQARTETYSGVVPRYVMLHVQWKFNKAPVKR